MALGAAIATKIPNPFISIPLALASHFILETVPHWNPHLNTETKKYGKPTKKSTIITTIDATSALILGSSIAFSPLAGSTSPFVVLACCLASVIPDLIEAPYFFLGIKTKFLKSWIALQKSIQVDVSVIPGLITQLLVLSSTLYWIFI